MDLSFDCKTKVHKNPVYVEIMKIFGQKLRELVKKIVSLSDFVKRKANNIFDNVDGPYKS